MKDKWKNRSIVVLSYEATVVLKCSLSCSTWVLHLYVIDDAVEIPLFAAHEIYNTYYYYNDLESSVIH